MPVLSLLVWLPEKRAGYLQREIEQTRDIASGFGGLTPKGRARDRLAGKMAELERLTTEN